MCPLAIKAKIIPTTPAIPKAIAKLVIISLLDEEGTELVVESDSEELDSEELDSEESNTQTLFSKTVPGPQR